MAFLTKYELIKILREVDGQHEGDKRQYILSLW